MQESNHSIFKLQQLYTKISKSRNNPNIQQFPQHLNQLGKLLIWGDRNNSDYFDYFCQVKGLDLLLQLFSKCKQKQIIIAIIGFFNILLTNFTKQQSINYLLSHPCIISLQMAKFGNMVNQVAEYYINFLKAIIKKISPGTIHLFSNKKYPNFPIISQTARFFNHPQNLVRTTCRNVLLSIAKLNNSKIDDFFVGFPFMSYYIHQANFIKQYWIIINEIIQTCDKLQNGINYENAYQIGSLDSVIQDHQQIIFYLDDLMHVGNPLIIDRVIDAFTNQCMAPMIQTLSSDKKLHFSLKLAVFICAVLFKTIQTKKFLDSMLITLFGRYYTRQLSMKLFNPTQKILSYNKQWKFKGFWDSHEQKINQYCIKKYHPEKAIVSDLKLNQKKQISENKKVSMSIDTISVFGINTNFYDRQVEKLENIFGISITTSPQFFKKKPATGIFEDLKRNASIGLDLNKCEQNPVRQGILSFLTSKDDTLVILTINLFLCVLNNKQISQQVLQFCGLSVTPKQRDFQSIMTIQLTISYCIGIMMVDPPSFRICTYKYASDLIQKLSKLYSENNPFSKQIVFKMKQALKVTIERINPYIYSGKQWQKVIQIFNNVSQQLNKNRPKNLKVYGLIPNQAFNNPQALKDKIKMKNIFKVNKIFDQFPSTLQQQIARDFWLYMIVRDLFYSLFTKEPMFIIQNIDKQPGKNHHAKYQIGKQCKHQNQFAIKAQQITQLSSDNIFTWCDILLLGGFIVIRRQSYIVQYKCNYKDASLMNDSSDPRKLLLILQGNALSILLENHFEQMKITLMKYQLTQIVKQVQNALVLCQQNK